MINRICWYVMAGCAFARWLDDYDPWELSICQAFIALASLDERLEAIQGALKPTVAIEFVHEAKLEETK